MRAFLVAASLIFSAESSAESRHEFLENAINRGAQTEFQKRGARSRLANSGRNGRLSGVGAST